MAEIIQIHGLPDEYEVVCTSDWHCGSKAFHEDALDALIAWVLAKPNRFIGHGGDMVEGKRIDSPHFNPDGLRSKQLKIGEQIEWVREKVRRAADRFLWIGLGNHDIYVQDADLIRCILAEPLGIADRLGGYQTWVDLDGLRGHVYHGRATMPRGAKDPIQRDANQRAWLVNRLAPLAGDAHFHLMGHVHALLVQPPVEQYALLTGEGGVRARYFTEPEQPVRARDHEGMHDDRVYVPPGARWYGCTGTLRRSGGFGWIDYGEVAGFPPAPIGWLVMRVQDRRVVDLRKVIV